MKPIALALVLGVVAAFSTASARAEWLSGEEAIMGTRCAVELWSTDRVRGKAAIASVFADMRRIDALMSTYKADSEISRINAQAATAPVPVSKELFDLIATSIEYSRLSSGVFDITYASVGYLYDYRAHQRPDEGRIAAALPSVDYRLLRLDPAKHTIAFGRAGMRIDLGGIAKGYSVDRGIEILKRAGVANAMVNAGGDTRVLGDRRGKPWMVGIRHPDDRERVVLRLPLTDAAFSTSGDYERYFDEGGVRYHHILDPRTGKSPHEVRSATLIADTALRTDGLSKTVFILGPEKGIEFINGLRDVDAVIVAADGKVRYSRGLEPPAEPAAGSSTRASKPPP